MNKFGTTLGLIALAGIVAGFTLAPSSCSSLTPEQQQRLQSIAVPAAGILSEIAVRKGYIEPGDKITIQRGVAVVTSADDPQAKIFSLVELGITDALNKGLVNEGDVITLKNKDVITIASPEPLPATPPGELGNQLLPPPGG